MSKTSGISESKENLEKQDSARAGDATISVPAFHAGMTVQEAMQVHQDAAIIFSSYHLGGCSHCSINEIETIEQVCLGYGVPVEELIASLNNLLKK